MKRFTERQVSQIDAALDLEEKRNYRNHFLRLLPRNDIVKEIFQKWIALSAEERLQIRDMVLGGLINQSEQFGSNQIYRLVYYFIQAMNYWSQLQDTAGACGVDNRDGNISPRSEHDLYRVTHMVNRAIEYINDRNRNRPPPFYSSNNSGSSSSNINQSQGAGGRGDAGLLSEGMYSKLLDSFDWRRRQSCSLASLATGGGPPGLTRRSSGALPPPESGDCNNNEASYAAFREFVSGEGFSDTPSSSSASSCESGPSSGDGSACEVDEESSGCMSEDESKPPKYFYVPTPSPSPTYD